MKIKLNDFPQMQVIQKISTQHKTLV